MAAVKVYVSVKMIIWILVFGTALSAPTDEFGVLVNDGELTLNDDKYVMHIVPGIGFSPQKLQIATNNEQKVQLSDIVDKESRTYNFFMRYVMDGYTNKGLTFNIYDSEMRDAAIALYQLLRDIKEDEDFDKVKEWAKHNLNVDMFEYAWRLVSLYDGKFGEKEIEPLFRFKPNHFVNSETIIKALKLKLKDGHFSDEEAEINQFFRVTNRENVIAINTNYSNWNSVNDEWSNKIDYFTEDISLNSYYYGVHLLHPFWMPNYKLDELNSRHAEQYYFVHQQLMARYLLEKERFKVSNISVRHFEKDYNPQLIYDNGVPFPVEPTLKKDMEWSDNLARVSSMYTAIRECISRGIIFMDNGTIIKLTEDNYVDLITKLIRANFDSIKTAKLIRSVYGYGPNGYPLDKYNPAPSLLHHPETSLRSPAYWYMIKYMLDHYKEYRKLLKPYDLSKDETEEYCILNFDYDKIATYFNYYQFQINNAVDRYNSNCNMSSRLKLTARQSRLTHAPFSLNFTVQSVSEKDVVIRLFLGPKCLTDDECWRNYSKFYQLDAYTFNLKSGTNDISWSPNKSKKLSFDEIYNMENFPSKQSDYNIFKFPANLLIPKGLEDGLNLTLFIMITPAEDSNAKYEYNRSSAYNRFSLEEDSKPLGFPFHRPTTGYSHSACNYKYFNITVFHRRWPVDSSGFFSPHLY